MISAMMIAGAMLVPPPNPCVVVSRYACVRYGGGDVELECDRSACTLTQRDGDAVMILRFRNLAGAELMDLQPGPECLVLEGTERTVSEGRFRQEIRFTNRCEYYSAEMEISGRAGVGGDADQTSVLGMLASTSLCVSHVHGARCPDLTLFFILPDIGWQLDWPDEQAEPVRKP